MVVDNGVEKFNSHSFSTESIRGVPLFEMGLHISFDKIDEEMGIEDDFMRIFFLVGERLFNNHFRGNGSEIFHSCGEEPLCFGGKIDNKLIVHPVIIG